MKFTDIRKLVSFLFEIGTLRKIARSYRQTLFTEELSDNIASHSFRVAMIGWFLAEAMGANSSKVIKMCLLHDIEESRSGDQNWVHKKYVKVFEGETRDDQLKDIPLAKELLTLSKEYEERKTLEAEIAKDADLVDQVISLREYQWQGNKEAEKWLKAIDKPGRQEELMSTRIAKQIAREAKKQRPSLWWDKAWTSKRR